MSIRFILSIDQGTTGTTALIINENLEVMAHVKEEYPQIYPRPGWVEHNPEDIWNSTLTAIEKVLAKGKVNPAHIGAIGITNQRETCIIWDRKTHRPIYNAIVWQCRRTADYCRELKSAGHEEMIRDKTGLVLDPYFSGTKVQWLLDNVPSAREQASTGALAFGTIDTFLVWRLTGGMHHVTDVSNASRTMLLNLRTVKWDPELLELFRIPEALLPEVRQSSEIYGTTKNLSLLPDGIPISGIAGDQQAALFGQACFRVGESKCTYGTGAFLVLNTGNEIKSSRNGLLTTIAWGIDNQITYALEGSVFIAGAAVQWLRDGLKIISHASEIEALARSVDNSGGVVFVPAFVGLGAPYWNDQVRGTIFGLSRGTTRAHIARATLESIALQCYDVFNAMEEDLGQALTGIKVDGGACNNDLLMQFQSNLLQKPILRPRIIETTGLGAALLAGLSVGMWKDLDTVTQLWQVDREFSPSSSAETIQPVIDRWHESINRLISSSVFVATTSKLSK